MPLARATKTVLLSEGMREDADSFLLESPAMSYIENGQFNKTGEVSKRNGFLELTDNGFTVEDDGTPKVLHAQGNNLYTITNGAASFYDGSSWNTVETSVPIAGLDWLFTSEVKTSITSFDYLVYTNTNIYSAVSVMETPGTDSASRRVFYTAHNADGTLLWRKELSGSGMGPADAKIVNAGLLGTAIIYSDGANNSRSIKISYFNSGTGVVSGTSTISSSTLSQDPNVSVTLSASYGQIFPTSWFVVSKFPTSDSAQYLAYTEDTGDMILRLLTSGYTATGTDITYNSAAVGAYQPLAINRRSDSDRMYIMYCNGIGLASTQVYIQQRVRSTAVFSSANSYSPGSDLFQNIFSGTVVQMEDENKLMMLWSGGDGLFIQELAEDTTGTIDPVQIQNHRLTTNAIYKDGKVYAGVQQISPDIIGTITGSDTVENRQHNTPFTTTFCEVSFTERYLTPVAALDVGQSKHTNGTETWTNPSLATPYVSGETITLQNRVMLSAEDWTFNGSENKINTYVIDLVPERVPTVGFGDGVLIGSAFPLWFDGKALLEVLPINQPEIMYNTSAAVVDAFSYADTDADYKIQFVAGYTDASGNIHRSAPSTLVYLKNTGDDADTPLVATPISAIDDTNYFLECYLSSDLDGPMRLAKTVSVNPQDTEHGITIQSYTGTTPTEKAIIRNTKFLYTEGGVLPADAWPSFKHATTTSTRMWVIGNQGKGTVFYSKLFEEFVAPEFSASLVIPFGDERELTAIGVLDDKIIVFEDNAIHVIYGQGPDNTGSGGDFAVSRIATDVGTTEPLSVVTTPKGLLFKSTRGIHLLDRSLNVQFIGGPVEDITLSTLVTSAVIIPSKGEVRFTLKYDGTGTVIDSDGPTPEAVGVDRPPTPYFGDEFPTNAAVVWNYENNQWSVFSNYQANAACLYQGKYTRLLSDWSVWQEDDSTWTDPSGEYGLKLRLPWVKFGALQDFAKVLKLTFLGKYYSSFKETDTDTYEAGDITVRLRHDYEKDVLATKVFKAAEAFQKQVRDGGAIRAERLQFSMRPKRSKTQAVQVEIEETSSAALSGSLNFSLGRGFSISGIDIEYGKKSGSAKLGKERKG